MSAKVMYRGGRRRLVGAGTFPGTVPQERAKTIKGSPVSPAHTQPRPAEPEGKRAPSVSKRKR